MNTEKTINIQGQDIRMRYCAAAETGFERICENVNGHRMDVFLPQPKEFDNEGNPTKYEPPRANLEDFIRLALAAIVAAYLRVGEDSPITFDTIATECTPKEILTLCATVKELREEWYGVPKSVAENETNDEGQKKGGRKRKNR